VEENTMADLRRKSEKPIREMIWNGQPERAAEINQWARDSAFNARWQWRPDQPSQPARVLIQLDGDQGGQEWAPVPLGGVIRRDGDPTDQDAPLALVVPPGDLAYVRS
jgi:hypothetical protein